MDRAGAPRRGHGSLVHLLPSGGPGGHGALHLSPRALRVAERISDSRHRDRGGGARGPFLSRAWPLPGLGFSRPPRARARRGSLSFCDPALWSYGVACFFIKLMRYSFLFWLPYYLHTAVGFGDEKAGYLSTSFEIGGIAGAILIGHLSDRLPDARARVSRRWRWWVSPARCSSTAGSRRAPRLPSSPWWLSSVRCSSAPTPWSPEPQLRKQAAPETAALATGFVNGIGSMGGLLQGWATVGIQAAWGWTAVFYVFVGLALLSAASLVPTFGTKRPPASP